MLHGIKLTNDCMNNMYHQMNGPMKSTLIIASFTKPRVVAIVRQLSRWGMSTFRGLFTTQKLGFLGLRKLLSARGESALKSQSDYSHYTEIKMHQ